MIFFLSQQARTLFTTACTPADDIIMLRMYCDQIVLNNEIKDFYIENYEQSYRYLTEQFVTRDYTRIDLLKICELMRKFEIQILEKVANRCKQEGKFAISYLYAALENENGKYLEEYRKDLRIEQEVNNSPVVIYGSVRFENLREEIRIKKILDA